MFDEEGSKYLATERKELTIYEKEFSRCILV